MAKAKTLQAKHEAIAAQSRHAAGQGQAQALDFGRQAGGECGFAAGTATAAQD